jgi:rubrerythrin
MRVTMRVAVHVEAVGGEYLQGMKQERATYVVCDQCESLFKAGTFKDGTTPTACPTCRVGVDPAGQTVTIDTESRF